MKHWPRGLEDQPHRRAEPRLGRPSAKPCRKPAGNMDARIKSGHDDVGGWARGSRPGSACATLRSAPSGRRLPACTTTRTDFPRTRSGYDDVGEGTRHSASPCSFPSVAGAGYLISLSRRALAPLAWLRACRRDARSPRSGPAVRPSPCQTLCSLRRAARARRPRPLRGPGPCQGELLVGLSVTRDTAPWCGARGGRVEAGCADAVRRP